MSETVLVAISIFIFVFAVFILRYAIIAGVAFSIFYLRKQPVTKKIQKEFPSRRDYYREIGFSISTSVVFALVASLLLHPVITPYTQIYSDFNSFSIQYFIFSILLVVLIHDTYFYWMHRFMHIPGIYRFFHKVHHKSTNPSPWAAFSFHPLEAILEAGILIIVVFAFPLHRLALMSFILVMLIYNVYGHLGYELYSRAFRKSKIGKWLNTSIFHNYHHKYFEGNYGLYFTFWDRWMGTLREE